MARPDNFQERLKAFREHGLDRSGRIQLNDILRGHDDEGIQESHYPGWKRDDIKALLEELGQLDKDAA